MLVPRNSYLISDMSRIFLYFTFPPPGCLWNRGQIDLWILSHKQGRSGSGVAISIVGFGSIADFRVQMSHCFSMASLLNPYPTSPLQHKVIFSVIVTVICINPIRGCSAFVKIFEFLLVSCDLVQWFWVGFQRIWITVVCCWLYLVMMMKNPINYFCIFCRIYKFWGCFFLFIFYFCGGLSFGFKEFEFQLGIPNRAW